MFKSILFINLFSLFAIAKPLTTEQKIERGCVKYNLPCDVVKAILKQESQWKVNAINKHSKDYGIGQINIKIIKAKNLNKARLLTDEDYSIDEALKHLAWFYKVYKHEHKWWCRYNVGTGDLNAIAFKCIQYVHKVSMHME